MKFAIDWNHDNFTLHSAEDGAPFPELALGLERDELLTVDDLCNISESLFEQLAARLQLESPTDQDVWDALNNPGPTVASDLAKVDAHEIQPEEYVEAPELTEEQLASAVKTTPFDAAEHINNPEALAELLVDAEASGNDEYIKNVHDIIDRFNAANMAMQGDGSIGEDTESENKSDSDLQSDTSSAKSSSTGDDAGSEENIMTEPSTETVTEVKPVKAAKKKAAPKAAKKKAAKKAAAPKVAKAKKPAGDRGKKTAEIKRLLLRKNGATRKDILEATGWPAVSVQQIAKNAGLKLTKTKEKGSVTTYFGTEK